MVKIIVLMLVIVFYVENKVFPLYGIIKNWKIDVDGTIYFIVICSQTIAKQQLRHDSLVACMWFSILCILHL